MQGLINEKADMPRANIAFLADAFGTMMGGLLGSSALTTYVESAAAVKEGGRTGVTAVVCSLFFFASVFLWPVFRCVIEHHCKLNGLGHAAYFTDRWQQHACICLLLWVSYATMEAQAN
jgi:xanthine/uracil/vitamin C permease (AzgA family)